MLTVFSHFIKVTILFVWQEVKSSEYAPFGSYSRSVLRINVTETANYTCYALNQMTGGRQSHDQKSFMVYVDTDQDKSASQG